MKRILLFVACFALQSCYDNYEYQLPTSAPAFTVDVWLGDLPGASRMSFGWTQNFVSDCLPKNVIPCVTYPAVIDVLLTDDLGGRWSYELNTTYPTGTVDEPLQGFRGQPERTYRLRINVSYNQERHEYFSETKMLRTPKIDAIDYIIREGEIGKGDLFVPLISFVEPKDERNYYLFLICMEYSNSYQVPQSWVRCLTGNRAWPFSVMTDTFLPEYVKGLSMDDGATIAKYAQFYPNISGSGGGAKVLMYSINEQTYNYYKATLGQFDYDGGSYFPTPATPSGNISNGAVGLFRATQVSGSAVFIQ